MGFNSAFKGLILYDVLHQQTAPLMHKTYPQVMICTEKYIISSFVSPVSYLTSAFTECNLKFGILVHLILHFDRHLCSNV